MNDCELISRSKVDALEKENDELDAAYCKLADDYLKMITKKNEYKEKLKEANEEVTYWIRAYQDEVKKSGRVK